MIVELVPLDLLFVIYDYESPSYRFNTVKFLKKLKPTRYYWISIAYCFTIKHKFYDPPPIDADESVHQAIRTA